MSWYAYGAAERQEEERHLSAVAVVVGQHILGNVLYGRIFACRRPWEVLVNPLEDASCLGQRCGGASCETLCEGAYLWCEHDVLVALRGVGLVERRGGVVGLHVGCVEVEPCAVGIKLKLLAEDRGLACLCLLLHIDRRVGVGHGRALIVGLAGREQLDVLLAHDVGARHGQPAAHGLARRHHIGFHRHGVAYAEMLGVAQMSFGAACLLHDGACVVGAHLLVAVASRRVALGLQRGTCLVYAEQVWGGVIEVAFLAVYDPTLQFSCLLPLVHLSVGDIGDVFADILLHLVACLREVGEQTVVQVSLPRIFVVGGLHDVRRLCRGSRCRCHEQQSRKNGFYFHSFFTLLLLPPPRWPHKNGEQCSCPRLWDARRW